MRFWKKIKDSRGESLVEVLASTLIGSLSVIALVTMIITSRHINGMAETGDEVYYRNLEAAEARVTPAPEPGEPAPAIPTGTVTIEETGKTDVAYPVEYYGGDDIWSYQAAVTPTSVPGGGP